MSRSLPRRTALPTATGRRAVVVAVAAAALAPAVAPALAGASGRPQARPAATHDYAETTGGLAHTWSDYEHAAGRAGPTIAGHQTIEIACRVKGYRVTDGNVWWYRIASAPWNGRYYVTADAFYNNGHRSGSLLHTPFFDSRVPVC